MALTMFTLGIKHVVENMHVSY